MNSYRRALHPTKTVLTCIVLPGAMLLSLPASTYAQTAAAPPIEANPVHLDVSKAHIVLKKGSPVTYDFCHGAELKPPSSLSDEEGLKLDTSLGQCGKLSGPSTNSAVTGGNPPYHFQLDTMGGFPPIGMHLGLDGLLYGTPSAKPPQGGFQPFSVCAVDMGGTQECQKLTVTTAAANAGSGAAKVLIIGGAVAASVAVAAAVALGSSKSSSTLSGGQCSGLSSVNACGSCTSDDQCGSGGVCFLYSSDNGQVAPFCSN
jgi:hypothetical protein